MIPLKSFFCLAVCSTPFFQLLCLCTPLQALGLGGHKQLQQPQGEVQALGLGTPKQLQQPQGKVQALGLGVHKQLQQPQGAAPVGASHDPHVAHVVEGRQRPVDVARLELQDVERRELREGWGQRLAQRIHAQVPARTRGGNTS